MKKILYGTTALVSAGVMASSAAQAEGGIKLGLGGYMNNYFGAGKVDDDDNRFEPTGLYSDGEVWFIGETTLDNGLKFGANIQLEGYTESDQIDENYGYVEGGFGRVQFGSENVAAYLMQFSAPEVGAFLNSGWITIFIPPPEGFNAAFRTPALSTYLDIGNDENLLTYFTPRLYGFQLGLSYIPTIVDNGDGKNFPVQADKDSEYNHGFSVGLNFVESFGGLDVAVAAGYSRANGPQDDLVILDPASNGGAGAPVPVRTINRRDRNQFSFGVNLSYAGFGLFGSYAAEPDGRVTPTSSSFTTSDFSTTALASSMLPANLGGDFTLRPNTYTSGADSSEGVAYEAAINYAVGPWIFQGTYFHGESEGDVLLRDEDRLDAGALAVQYAVGPGIDASLTAMYANYRGENGLDNQGIIGIAGVTFSF